MCPQGVAHENNLNSHSLKKARHHFATNFDSKMMTPASMRVITSCCGLCCWRDWGTSQHRWYHDGGDEATGATCHKDNVWSQMGLGHWPYHAPKFVAERLTDIIVDVLEWLSQNPALIRQWNSDSVGRNRPNFQWPFVRSMWKATSNMWPRLSNLKTLLQKHYSPDLLRMREEKIKSKINLQLLWHFTILHQRP